MLASAHGREIEPDRLQAANRSLPAHVDGWTDETNLVVCRARIPASANAEYALSSVIMEIVAGERTTSSITQVSISQCSTAAGWRGCVARATKRAA